MVEIKRRLRERRFGRSTGSTYAAMRSYGSCSDSTRGDVAIHAMRHIPISLGDIRAAIIKSRRVSFTYQKAKVVADFYLLGQARKTGAYIIIAWTLEPMEEWTLLRYSFIKDLEPVGRIDVIRHDFSPHHPKLATVDTMAFHSFHRSLPVAGSHV